jgi:hypothetical protein
MPVPITDLITKRGTTEDGSQLKAGATNLTLGSGIVALITVLGADFAGFAQKVLGEPEDQPNIDARKDLLVALILGWAFLAAADVLGRAYAKAATERRKAAETQAKAVSQRPIPVPPGLKASVPEKDHDEERNWTVVAMLDDPSHPGKFEYLLVKAGFPAEWQSEDKLKFK